MARASANWLWEKYEDNLGGGTVSEAVSACGWNLTGGNRTGAVELRGAETPKDTCWGILLRKHESWSWEASLGQGRKGRYLYCGPFIGDSLAAALLSAFHET